MSFTAKSLIAGVFATALLGVAQTAGATTILFNDFSDVSGLQLNGRAATVGNGVTDDANRKVLRLTDWYSQSGSAFSTNTVSLAANASFSSAFKFRITESQGICDEDGCGADGLVFVVQTVANNVGGSGGGIGYQGIARSVGIEYDTWNNGGWDDNNGNHVGVDLNGDINSVSQVNLPTGGGTRMNNGSVWTSWVDYNGDTDLLEVRLAEGENASRPGSALLSYTVDLATILQTTDAFVGFTSGTGAAMGRHDILGWQFNSTYQPIDVIGNPSGVPEPSTVALAGVALVAMAVARRRRHRM